MIRRCLALTLAVVALAVDAAPGGGDPTTAHRPSRPAQAGQRLFYPGSVAVLPQDGRAIYLEAFAAARSAIRIEICVLEDPDILHGLQQAIDRGVHVRVIVDHGKYDALAAERENLAAYLTGAGVELHVSNPIFPRSFPKVILVDDRYALIGSACLDTTTFDQYRDYAHVTNVPGIVTDLSRLFENDWRHSAGHGQSAPAFNPTPVVTRPDLVVSPVTATWRLVTFIQGARKSLDVATELLGNATLESELAAAVARGVRVRLIAPQFVNGATPDGQDMQIASLTALKTAGVQVHVTRPPETAQTPYMHARIAVADGRRAYLGSVSLSPDAATRNRDVGLISDSRNFVDTLRRQFEIDFAANSQPY